MGRFAAVAALVFAIAACQRTEDAQKITTNASHPGSGSGVTSSLPERTPPPTTTPTVEQVTPPVDLKDPPIDAVKTSSGLVYKRLTTVADAPTPKRNDTVMITYTAWRQTNGETFFSNKQGQPMPLPLSNTAPGFTEAMQILRKGERAMLWLPPEIGFKGGKPPPGTKAETLCYEVEIVEIVPAPEVPPDVGNPPPTAKKLPSGLSFAIVKPGTGKDKARFFDTVTFNYTAWDTDGRMFDSTEMRKRPATVPPYRQSAVMEEILTSMTAGERRRVWIPAERMTQGGKPLAGMPTGVLTYEIEMITIAKGNQPPPVPANLAKPPDDAKKTTRGVSYKVLATKGNTRHPELTDSVKVHYTGWTTDGRMFDSSVVKGQTSEFSLGGVMAGWVDALSAMGIGDRARFWIPEELAYKGAPGRPQGMLVFDIELFEIISAPPAPPPIDPGHAEAEDPKAPGGPDVSPPADVAAPPAGAKKSPRGVSYKILTAVPGAKRPTLDSTILVRYTGWNTNGQMFDSSKKQTPGPVTFKLSQMIAGWKDALPLVGVGETVRLWVPEELAYKGLSGPQGMLVFDIELVEIK